MPPAQAPAPPAQATAPPAQATAPAARDAAPSRQPAADVPPDTFVQVTLEGKFGRFRTKVADVQICDKHVSLLYTGVGDDDLAYEPPERVPFSIVVPLVDATGARSSQRVTVMSFGMITRLPHFNAVLAVFPRAAEGTERAEAESATEGSAHDQEEHSVPDGDGLWPQGLQ